jgi:protein gp37
MSTTASAIEWTDATWNPVVGCKMVSPGCANCYAETMSNRLAGMALADDVKLGAKPTRKDHYLKVIDFERGRFNGKVQLVPEALADPLGWRKPRRVFVNSMSDLFHEGVPFEYVDKVFAVMALTPHHTYQILTKRPERMAEYLRCLPGRAGATHAIWSHLAFAARNIPSTPGAFSLRAEAAFTWPLPNLWLGTSIEDRERLDERAMKLAECPAAVPFWSLEPLLEDLGNIRGYLEQGVRWVIVGGESGHGARPCNVEWVRSIVDQCKAAGTACFVKQLGSDPFTDKVETANNWPIPLQIDGDFKPIRLMNKKGGDMAEWPSDLRVREMPQLQDSSR